MRKLIVFEYMTLDGVVESPEQWQFPYYAPDVSEFIIQQIHSAGGFLLGRVTYEIFSNFWPTQRQNEFGIADKLNHAPKFVVSTTLQQASWQGTTILSRDILAEIRALKQAKDEYLAMPGSFRLVESLAPYGLIDEYRFLVHPLIWGQGRRFQLNQQVPLRMLETRTFSSGVVYLAYAPAPSTG